MQLQGAEQNPANEAQRPNPVGEALGVWRERQRLSQRDVGVLLGVSKATVSRWESGLQKIDANELPSIAGRLGLHPCDFFQERVEDVSEVGAPEQLMLTRELISVWRGVPDDQREVLETVARAAAIAAVSAMLGTQREGHDDL